MFGNNTGQTHYKESKILLTNQKTETMNERDVRFDTEYEIKNPRTGSSSMMFRFEKSTGPEFDPATRWIYWNLERNVKLEVCNDPHVTKLRADAYLKAKLRKPNDAG